MYWRKLLYPFSLPYQLVTSLRNWAFDKSILPSREFEVPVIAIGNLSSGGTGKTPMTEFLIRHFATKKIGLVSRGYGRKTKGLVVGTPEHRFDEIGDEPFQVFHKFPQIKLALAERRVQGIEALLKNENLDLILLDDAYQHRYVKPGFQILLTTFEKPFYKDFILPAGNLREGKTGRKRADVVVITKCPDDLKPGDAENLRRKLKLRPRQAVYFCGLEYGEPLNHMEVALPKTPRNTSASESVSSRQRDKIMVVTGIANPRPMLSYLKNHHVISSHMRFPDHHHFSKKNLADIEQRATEADLPIVTTEKDWVRLKTMLSPKMLDRTFYLPMQVKVLFGEEGLFLKKVEEFIKG